MTIYYWAGAQGSEVLLNNHKDAIQRILNGEYNCNDLEKLRTNFSHPVYSFRLSRGRRLLFTTHHGYLHVLEYLPIHNYDNCKTLKHGVLDRAMINFTPISDEEKPVFNADSDQSTSKALHYYDKRFIALSTAQENILQNIALPAMINGAAGSGKTLISLLKLAAQHRDEKLLYLSKQQHLVDKMKSAWEDGLAPESITVEFKTFDNLIQDDIKPDDNIKTPVDVTFFKTWYNGLKDERLITLNDIHAYQELYICSGFKREDYHALGERQSSIPSAIDARDAFYSLYERYLDYLDAAKKVDPAFHVFTASTPKYDLIVVDEGQNLSLMQNRQLAELCNNSIIFCIDQHQNLVTSQASRVLLEQSFQRDGVALTTHSLDVTHRCAQLVAHAVDKVLEIGRAIRGGKADKHEALSMHADPSAPEGEFYLMSPSMDTPSWIINRAKSTELAVVTAREFINEARERFNTALVFTPEEIIGQEYHTVVVYKLLATQLSLAILKDIKPKLLAATHKSHTHLSKEKDINFADKHAVWINELFIACSRAQYSLIIMENESRNNVNFLQPFKTITAEKPVDDSILLSHDWQAMSQQQAKLGNTHIAARIDTMHLPHSGEKSGESHKPVLPEPKKRKPKPITLGKQQPEKSIIMESKPQPQPQPQFDDALSSQLIGHIRNYRLQQIKVLLRNPKLNINLSLNGKTVFMFACCYGPVDIFSALLTHPTIKVNYADPNGTTPLMLLALNKGHQDNHEKISILLSHPETEVNLTNSIGNSALMLAAEDGNSEAIKVLLRHPTIDVNQTRPDSANSLLMAASGNHTDVVRALLTHPMIEVNQISKSGSSALMMAALKGNTVMVQALLDHPKINVNIKMADGTCPLILAAEEGHTEVVRTLLAHREIDVNQTRTSGSSSLIMAATNNHSAVVRILLGHAKINVNHTMPNNAPAWALAAQVGHTNVINEFLRDTNFDVNQTTSKGETILILAATWGHTDIVHQLLAHPKININQTMPSGQTAYMCASKYKHIDACILITIALFESHQPFVPQENDWAIESTLGQRFVIDNQTVREWAMKYAMDHILHNNAPFIVKLWLNNDELFKQTLVKISEQSAEYKPPLSLLVGLISYRERIWSLLQSNDALGLTPDEHRTILTHIYESRSKPEPEQHIFYKALFKLIASKTQGLFKDNVAQPTIEAIENLLSLHEASYVEPNQAKMSRPT